MRCLTVAALGTSVLLGAIAPTARADDGKVCFFRASGVGAAIVIGVREGDEKLLNLRARRSHCLTASPGTHVYWAKTEARTEVTVDVADGATVFVEGTMRMGFAVGHPHLALSTEAEYAEAASKLKPAEPGDVDPAE